ncbi:MAG: DUF3298 and DUF4163 domain-containing protein [Desulfovibrio sp.]|nr:DUF3298 and DUF4163 domain-containing protein [Desulfovibrio sp.]
MQRRAFFPLALFVILVASLLLTAPRAQAAAEARPNPAADAAKAADGAKTTSAGVETPATSPEASVSRIESIAQESPAAAPEPENATPEQSIYPGVMNIHIQSGGDGTPKVSLNYPAFKTEAVDADIRAWAEAVVRSYEEEVRAGIAPDGEKPGSYGVWELSGMYSLERPSPQVVSVIFNIFSYTGGAHGNLVINCRNYDLASGKRLDFADLFKNPEKALELMSAYARESLTKSLGEESDEEMIREGTAPELNNFGELALTPAGVTIQFQPYQVGPWSAGPQQVEMPLAALASAGPEGSVWPDAARAAKGDGAATPPASDGTAGERK